MGEASGSVRGPSSFSGGASWTSQVLPGNLCTVNMDLLRSGWSQAPVPEMPRQRPSYRRVQAPIYHRPTSWFAQGLPRRSAGAPQDGVRSYSDDALKPGRLLEMDVYLPDGGLFTALVLVEWCDPLPRGVPARFDVGMKLVQIAPADKVRLDSVLG